MSPAGAHVRKRKFHRVGRHAASSPLATAGKWAGRLAPVVVLAGVIAIAPDIYHLAASPTSIASDLSGANGHSTTVRGRDAKEGQAGRARHHAGKSAPSRKAHRVTLTCSGSGGILPANYEAIVRFLMGHGYTGLAAAGIAGNIYRESLGNPESVGTGGGGLIGWTPLPSGFVTGNPAADLRTQLSALLTYNQQWSQYLPALNAATSATQAADIYMNDFERPGVPAASEREAAAVAVAAACHL